PVVDWVWRTWRVPQVGCEEATKRGDFVLEASSAKTLPHTRTTLPLVLYGRAVTPRILMLEALWYGALRSQLVRIVVVRDPSGRRHAEAFFCTALPRAPAFILQTYPHRWPLEATFHTTNQPLGSRQA